MFGVLFLIAVILAFVARQDNRRATRESPAGQRSVDQTLSSAASTPRVRVLTFLKWRSSARALKRPVVYVDFLKQDARDPRNDPHEMPWPISASAHRVDGSTSRRCGA